MRVGQFAHKVRQEPVTWRYPVKEHVILRAITAIFHPTLPTIARATPMLEDLYLLKKQR